MKKTNFKDIKYSTNGKLTKAFMLAGILSVVVATTSKELSAQDNQNDIQGKETLYKNNAYKRQIMDMLNGEHNYTSLRCDSLSGFNFHFENGEVTQESLMLLKYISEDAFRAHRGGPAIDEQNIDYQDVLEKTQKIIEIQKEFGGFYGLGSDNDEASIEGQAVQAIDAAAPSTGVYAVINPISSKISLYLDNPEENESGQKLIKKIAPNNNPDNNLDGFVNAELDAKDIISILNEMASDNENLAETINNYASNKDMIEEDISFFGNFHNVIYESDENIYFTHPQDFSEEKEPEEGLDVSKIIQAYEAGRASRDKELKDNAGGHSVIQKIKPKKEFSEQEIAEAREKVKAEVPKATKDLMFLLASKHNPTSLRLKYNRDIETRDHTAFYFEDAKVTKEAKMLWATIDKEGFERYAKNLNKDMVSYSSAAHSRDRLIPIMEKAATYGDFSFAGMGYFAYPDQNGVPTAEMKAVMEAQIAGIRAFDIVTDASDKITIDIKGLAPEKRDYLFATGLIREGLVNPNFKGCYYNNTNLSHLTDELKRVQGWKRGGNYKKWANNCVELDRATKAANGLVGSKEGVDSSSKESFLFEEEYNNSAPASENKNHQKKSSKPNKNKGSFFLFKGKDR